MGESFIRAKSHGGVDYEEQNIIRVENLVSETSEKESSLKVRNDGSV